MPSVDSYLNFIKIKWVMTSQWRHLSFLRTNVHISNSNLIYKRHCSLDLQPRVIKYNIVQASAVSNHSSKSTLKSMHTFGWNFVHWQTDRHTHTHTHTHTHKVQWKYNPSKVQWSQNDVNNWRQTSYCFCKQPNNHNKNLLI